MIVTLVSVYLALSLFTYIYYQSCLDKLPHNIRYIVILSACSDYLTICRVKKGIALYRNHPNTLLVCCGKQKSQLMKNLLNSTGIEKLIIQNKSTNTYEDAIYCHELTKKGELLLVTQPSHARRSKHTFERVYKKKVWVCPTSKFLTVDSCLFPVGWIFSFINLVKDIKYNGRI